MSGVMFMYHLFLTASHTVSAIQTFVAGTAADSDMSAGITGRCIALHDF